MRAKLLTLAATVGVVVLGLTGCTFGGSSDRDTVSSASGSAASAVGASDSAGAGASARSTSPTDATAGSTSTASPEVRAAQSRFDDTNRALATGNGDAGDRMIVDALVSAGFDKGAMQITPDTTTIGRRVDSIQVSVLVGSTCLLGQFRGTDYVGATSPVLSTGRCLIGTTRAIDW